MTNCGEMVESFSKSLGCEVGQQERDCFTLFVLLCRFTKKQLFLSYNRLGNNENNGGCRRSALKNGAPTSVGTQLDLSTEAGALCRVRRTCPDESSDKNGQIGHKT